MAVEFQIGQRGVKRDVVAAVVLDHLLNEEFFHQLRTRDMLGYIVDCHSHRRHGYALRILPFRVFRAACEIYHCQRAVNADS